MMLKRYFSVPFLRAWTIALLAEITAWLGLALTGNRDIAANFSAVATPTILIVFIVVFILGMVQRRW